MTTGHPLAVSRPLVGLLYSAAAPVVIEAAGSLVESLDVIPERLFHDLGPGCEHRFHRVDGALHELRRHADGRHTSGHGIALSLPSDMQIDEPLLEAVADLSESLEFSWYSEHLSSVATVRGAVSNAQASLGLPVRSDDDVLTMLASKVDDVQQRLGMRLLLENPAASTPVPDCEYSEPAFLNELAHRTGCGVLLDLDNLYTNARNNDVDNGAWLDEIDLDNVVEVHLAGGTELFGFDTGSHAALPPRPVWDIAREYIPQMRNLQSLVFEIHESSLDRLGVAGIVGDLERIHELVDRAPAVAAA